MNTMDDNALPAALARLYARHTLGIKFGLEAERALLARLGDPHAGLRCLHVAGTNGKGSVCAMLESVYRAAGFRTGLYTSPHLVRFNERIAVVGAPIADADLWPLVQEVEAAAEEVGAALGQPLTFFEVSTAAAFLHFARCGVDVVVLETGMGGRLDATNVVTPLVAAITTIGLEHQAYLGPDRTSIAGEKAGIIKPGRPVVSGVRDPDAAAVVRAAARACGAPLVEAWEAVSVRSLARDWDGQKLAIAGASGLGGTVRLPLLGGHQGDNVALVLTVLEAAMDAGGPPLEWPAIKRGLEAVRWPGRLQVWRRDPVVLLDGAHNPAAAERLAETWHQYAPRQPVALVCGMCADKDARAFFRALAGPVKAVWLTPVASDRNMDASALRAAAAAGDWVIREAPLNTAMAEATDWAKTHGGLVCVAGSLFLVGEVLAMG